MTIRAKKTAKTVSRTPVCYISGKTSTEYNALLFCTEKIILSIKLNKRYQLKTRIMTDLELRAEAVDGC